MLGIYDSEWPHEAENILIFEAELKNVISY